jgi:hypothetical protein
VTVAPAGFSAVDPGFAYRGCSTVTIRFTLPESRASGDGGAFFSLAEPQRGARKLAITRAAAA